jgi:hypothetical protein
MTEKKRTFEEEEEDDYVCSSDEEEEVVEMCPEDNCKNERNKENKKGRCNECQKWWYETKRIFFGCERRCFKCQDIFLPETRDKTRDVEGYICDVCVEVVVVDEVDDDEIEE